jgi:MFS family permease
MSALHPWVMWFFAVLFFAYQFIMRVFLGLCVPEIMTKFHVDATEYGLLASMYYYGYAGMQIPIAILLDRFGPRSIISLSCFVYSVAVFLFYWTDQWYLALFARFLIGAASAAGFLGVSKIITLWFPPAHYARMVGLSFSLGLLGAIYGGLPVSYLIGQYGWETVLLMIGTVGLVLTGLLVLTLKPHKHFLLHGSPSILKELKALLSMPILIFMGFANLLMVGSLEGFADVWGVPYLMAVYEYHKNESSFITSAVYTGMLIGGPLLAYIAEKFKVFYQTTALCGIMMALLLAVMLLSNGAISYTALYVMMFMVGVLCCYQVLVFAIGTMIVPPEMRNMTVAFLNGVNMLGGCFFHPIIGYIMDMFWKGQVAEGQRVYEAHAYTYAVSAIPIAACIGGIIFLFLRPTEKGKALQL